MEEHSALLRLVRAVSVLDGVAAEPTDSGVRATAGRSGPMITWPEVAELLGDGDPLDRAPRLRLAVRLVLQRSVSRLGSQAVDVVRDAARPLALPPGHPLHLGAGWVREPVPGGVLDLGIGVVGLAPGPDVLPLPPRLAALAGLDDDAWPRLRRLGEEWSDIALAKLSHAGHPRRVLAGAGGVDALTVLALPGARQRLAGPVAAPARDVAWLGQPRRFGDEGFAQAVWTLTSPARRGVLEALAVGPAGVAPLRPAHRSGSSPIGS